MPFIAKVIADSISPAGRRLTTIEMTYPLIVHNELLTHRMLSRSGDWYLDFSRNSSSNRAIPSSTIIEAVKEDPYIPAEFRKTTRGMVAGDTLTQESQWAARFHWLQARDYAVYRCESLDELGVHKQWRNRLLTPFQWITTVCTGVDEIWEHFFGLRDNESAQPDIAYVAHLAHRAYLTSEPTYTKIGNLHLPYVTEEERSGADDEKSIIRAVARCARVSYLREGEVVDYAQDAELFNRLQSSNPPHASPFEHVAYALESAHRGSGNLVGWQSIRMRRGLG